MIQKFLKEYLEKGLLVALLGSFLLNIHKVIVPNIMGNGVYNEYTDISLYLSDFIWGFGAIYVLIEHKIHKLSINRLFHVEQSVKNILFIHSRFLILSTVSILKSNDPSVSIRSLGTLFEIISFLLLLVC